MLSRGSGAVQWVVLSGGGEGCCCLGVGVLSRGWCCRWGVGAWGGVLLSREVGAVQGLLPGGVVVDQEWWCCQGGAVRVGAAVRWGGGGAVKRGAVHNLN